MHQIFSSRSAFAVERRIIYSLLCLSLLLLAGCTQPPVLIPSPQPEAAPFSATPTPVAQIAGIPTPTAMPFRKSSPLPTAAPELRLWVSPSVPQAIASSLFLPASIPPTDRREEASLVVDLPGSAAGEVAGQADYILALVAPFPTIVDDIPAVTLKRAWQGKSSQTFTTEFLFRDIPLLLDTRTLEILSAWWGPPSPGSTRTVAPDALLDTAWQSMPSWAIVPFEEIRPRWKVLRLDGVSPLDRAFDPQAYALSVPFQVTGSPEAVQAARAFAGDRSIITGNRDPDQLTVLVITGVTALTRRTALTMEREGITYPGRDIRPWLVEADLTHISNEVSFADDCPPGRPDSRFCSPSRYIELLHDIGTDIVELTGNHNMDWGSDAYYHSLELYQQAGWQVYGGGATLEDARRPLLVNHNGNLLAFLGCNAAGPPGAWVTPYHPGAATCELKSLEQEVQRLVSEGYLPIVTLQHIETDNYRPEVAQRMPEFRRLAEAGAVIVSGSQSHYPQTMTFIGNNFVHYGLGNLFFDQMELLATRQEFIDRHVFYQGRYLGVELLTALLEDAARPRPMSPLERSNFLKMIFNLCTWKNP